MDYHYTASHNQGLVLKGEFQMYNLVSFNSDSKNNAK